MTTFSNVLYVPLGRRDNAAALRRVHDLVARDHRFLSVLAVVPEASRLQRLLTPHDTEEAIQHRLCDEVERDLHAWCRRGIGDRTPVDVDIRVETGHPVTTVIGRALAGRHDLLVLGADAADGAVDAIVARLQRKSPCAVWVLRPSRARHRRILAAVDVDPTHDDLNPPIVEAACWLAAPGDEVHVVTAWELYGESTLRHSPFLAGGTDVTALRERCEQEHRSALADLVARYPNPPVPIIEHVVNGPAASVIGELVRRHRINHVVMGTLARTGIPGLLIGNTAEQLLTEIPVSILTVKPPGFVSPVVPSSGG